MKLPHRRQFMHLAAGAAALPTLSGFASAQTYPTRPVRLIVGFAAAEENKATVQGTITYFGTYSVSEANRTIAIHIEGSSFPNWDGADQKRLFVFSGDELKLISPAASGAGTAEVVWKRAK
jgi:Lipocalin-like domain